MVWNFNSKIREFVEAFFLRVLCGISAFFAFTILFENAKAAKRNPAKIAKVFDLKFQI